jgi:L-serine dehydratase
MISALDLFKIGIGPSSSHTVGPMKAALAFVENLAETGALAATSGIEVRLFGSLAWTGKGHGTDRAVVLGLAGEAPETVDPEAADAIVARIGNAQRLVLGRSHEVEFDPVRDVVFDVTADTPRHPNTLQFNARNSSGIVFAFERWCSVGGGFVVRESEVGTQAAEVAPVPYPFGNSAHLLRMGRESGRTIADMVLANELALHTAEAIEMHLGRVLDTMMVCIDRGLSGSGELPGGLRVRRRANALLQQFEAERLSNNRPQHEIMDQVSLFAIAVNEENAAGGRVVTAPTNGAAGVMPAVLRYYRDRCAGVSENGIRTFLLTATAVGALFKMNASISGAEVGCQGEVGVACSMAAAGLAAALGGSNEQIENAAEIGMEHHLGMTCDPVGGLVQIPCIERNAFGAIKAINAASLALHGDGSHRVSLDQVIATMRQTGADMQSKYKETSRGGLAVNFAEC